LGHFELSTKNLQVACHLKKTLLNQSLGNETTEAKDNRVKDFDRCGFEILLMTDFSMMWTTRTRFAFQVPSREIQDSKAVKNGVADIGWRYLWR
jgi:hypothetical protein